MIILKRALGFLFLSIFSAFLESARAVEQGPQFNCFEHHLRDAITLNEKKLPLYSEQTSGATLKLSKKLIRYEKLSILLAKYFDWRAKKYQKNGIPILCDEFVSMEKTPSFQVNPIPPKEPVPFPPALDTSEIKKRVKEAYKKSSFQGVANYVDRLLQELEHLSPYHCMVRHLLESISKTAKLGPIHMAAAQKAGLKSPEKISWDFIRVQLLGLSSADSLDQEAFPIQTTGVPFICNDVPKIE